MASESSNNTGINSIFSSYSGEHRWVNQMRKNFDKELKTDIYSHSPCISRVSQTLRAEKPEAYAPKCIGLGPYHHFRCELYQMERDKLAAAKKVLTTNQIANFRQLVVDKLVELVPSVRACYSDYLDLHDHTLAWIWAIDSLFLDYYLGICHRSFDSTDMELSKDTYRYIYTGMKFTQDIFMLENQIPFILLEEIQKAIRTEPPCANDKGKTTVRVSNDAKKWSVSDDAQVIYNFCKAFSPLKLLENQPYRFERTPAHLLDCLYHLVVNDGKLHLKVGRHAEHYTCESAKAVVDTAISVAQNIQPIIDRIKQLQLDKICSPLFKKQNTAVEIEIPSVSSLQKIGVKLAIAEGGIRGIKFEDETSTLKLPKITLNDNSEVILRNLMAYEALALPVGSTRELAEYIDLMCGIIDTAMDVKILQEKKIIVIQDYLSHDQIANIFNGITKSTDKQSVVGEVNKHYDSMLIVKAMRSVKKCLISSWNFVKASWKLLYFFYTITLISMLILKAFCDVYGFKQTLICNIG